MGIVIYIMQYIPIWANLAGRNRYEQIPVYHEFNPPHIHTPKEKKNHQRDKEMNKEENLATKEFIQEVFLLLKCHFGLSIFEVRGQRCSTSFSVVVGKKKIQISAGFSQFFFFFFLRKSEP